jgi:hypothetical protein
MAEHRIESHIDINAPPSRVWAMLTDFAEMPWWNPFIRSISGDLTPGARLSALIGPPGKSAMRFRPTVLAVRPEKELRWKGNLFLPGLCDGEHYFVLEPMGSGVRFIQGERFTGILVGLIRGAFSATEEGFKAMNTALKERAESRDQGPALARPMI